MCDGDESHPPVAGRYQDILELARPYLDTRGNEEHTEGSIAFAWQLLEAEGGDPDVVMPAIILHDVGWSELSDEEQLQAFGPPPTRLDLNMLHEQRGAEIAAGILDSMGYDPALTEEIAEIIRGHDNRRQALSLNDALVKDADRLFRLTRRGYMIFLEFFSLEYRPYLAAMTSVADEWFFTETAKRLGAEMFADLELYITELQAAVTTVSAGATDDGLGVEESGSDDAMPTSRSTP